MKNRWLIQTVLSMLIRCAKEARLTAYTAENGLADDGFVPITGNGQGGLLLGGSHLYHYSAG